MSALEERWVTYSRESLEDLIAARVTALRELADEIERESARGIADADAGKHEWSTYTRVAGQVVHAVSWGVANLNLSNLIEAASNADKVREELKS